MYRFAITIWKPLISCKIAVAKSRALLPSPVLCGVASYDIIRLFFGAITFSMLVHFEALSLLERIYSIPETHEPLLVRVRSELNIIVGTINMQSMIAHCKIHKNSYLPLWYECLNITTWPLTIYGVLIVLFFHWTCDQSPVLHGSDCHLGRFSVITRPKKVARLRGLVWISSGYFKTFGWNLKRSFGRRWSSRSRDPWENTWHFRYTLRESGILNLLLSRCLYPYRPSWQKSPIW